MTEKIYWYLNRLKAMSPKEIFWRLQQKKTQITERRRFEKKRRPVTSALYGPVDKVNFSAGALGLVGNSPSKDCSTAICLLGGYRYSDFATDWHAGFQSQEHWPLTWSYDLDYKQCDVIGDARTNWELNRHRQFVLMAKAYAISHDREILRRLVLEFDDWNAENPFLFGISWTSPMEFAIRSISWMYTLAFLDRAPKDELADRLKDELKTGIFNITTYLLAHYSRFSSANNHLLVEMLAIGLAGMTMNRDAWVSLAIDTFDRELYRQNSADGVNFEMSLHYHAFVLEAYLLMIHSMRASNLEVPGSWLDMIEKMASFISASRVDDNTFCEFGDDDQGRILDFSVASADYYTYILQFVSLTCKKRLDSFDTVNPTILWLFTKEDIENIKRLPAQSARQSTTFVEGGYSFLRNQQDSIMLAIDHAPLGFGAIAAHGHADALSFQLFVDGIPIFIDPGTYIYHIDLQARNAFRSTLNHNTVLINDTEQSEMRGAFLWGFKAQTDLLEYSDSRIKAQVTGMSGITHTREFVIEGNHGVKIIDSFDEECDWTATFILNPALEVNFFANKITIGKHLLLTSSEGDIKAERIEISKTYGIKQPSTAVRIYGHGRGNQVTINRI